MPPDPRGVRPSRRASRTCTALMLPALAGCGGVLDPQGPVSLAERTILIDSLAIMLAIVLPTVLAVLAFAWWFRAGNPRAQRLPDFAYSGRIELLTWGVPALTVMLLGGVTWISSHALDPARPLDGPPPLEVQVVSLDWKWLFIYPDQAVASVNGLVIPAGTPVRFTLTSASVMNSFFVPQLGSQLYTMNGMAASLNLQADRPGTYPGLSTHFSGDGFADMHFDVRAVPAAEFTAWVAATRASGPTLNAGTYAELARQGTVAPFTYRATEPGLFDRVVSGAVPPGPGPTNQPGQAPAAPARLAMPTPATPTRAMPTHAMQE